MIARLLIIWFIVHPNLVLNKASRIVFSKISPFVGSRQV